jgi:hypothetical protein
MCLSGFRARRVLGGFTLHMLAPLIIVAHFLVHCSLPLVAKTPWQLAASTEPPIHFFEHQCSRKVQCGEPHVRVRHTLILILKGQISFSPSTAGVIFFVAHDGTPSPDDDAPTGML